MLVESAVAAISDQALLSTGDDDSLPVITKIQFPNRRKIMSVKLSKQSFPVKPVESSVLHQTVNTISHSSPSSSVPHTNPARLVSSDSRFLESASPHVIATRSLDEQSARVPGQTSGFGLSEPYEGNIPSHLMRSLGLTCEVRSFQCATTNPMNNFAIYQPASFSNPSFCSPSVVVHHFPQSVRPFCPHGSLSHISNIRNPVPWIGQSSHLPVMNLGPPTVSEAVGHQSHPFVFPSPDIREAVCNTQSGPSLLSSSDSLFPCPDDYCAVTESRFKTPVIPLEQRASSQPASLFKCVNCTFVASNVEHLIGHTCGQNSGCQIGSIVNRTYPDNVVTSHMSFAPTTSTVIPLTTTGKRTNSNFLHHDAVDADRTNGPSSLFPQSRLQASPNHGWMRRCPPSSNSNAIKELPPTTPLFSIDLTLSDDEEVPSDQRCPVEPVRTTECASEQPPRSANESYSPQMMSQPSVIGDSLSNVNISVHERRTAPSARLMFQLHSSLVSTVSNQADASQSTYHYTFPNADSRSSFMLNSPVRYPSSVGTSSNELICTVQNASTQESIHENPLCCKSVANVNYASSMVSDFVHNPPGLCVSLSHSPSSNSSSLSHEPFSDSNSIAVSETCCQLVKSSRPNRSSVPSSLAATSASDTDGSVDDLIFMGFDLVGKTAGKRLYYCDECLADDRAVCVHRSGSKQGHSLSRSDQRKKGSDRLNLPPRRLSVEILRQSSNNAFTNCTVAPAVSYPSSAKRSSLWSSAVAQTDRPSSPDHSVVLPTSTPSLSTPLRSSSLPSADSASSFERQRKRRRRKSPIYPFLTDNEETPDVIKPICSPTKSYHHSLMERSMTTSATDCAEPQASACLDWLAWNKSSGIRGLRSPCRKSASVTESPSNPLSGFHDPSVETLNADKVLGLLEQNTSKQTPCDSDEQKDPHTRIMVDMLTGELFVDDVPLRDLVPGLKAPKHSRNDYQPKAAPPLVVRNAKPTRNTEGRQSKKRRNTTSVTRSSKGTPERLDDRKPVKRLRRNRPSIPDVRSRLSSTTRESTSATSVVQPSSPRVLIDALPNLSIDSTIRVDMKCL